MLLLTAGPASAHVRIEGEVPAGGSGTITFRVPTERDDASTTKLSVQMPEDIPLGSVSVQPKPGWKVETTKKTLDEPVEVFGEQVTEVVDTVTWTATGDGIKPGEYDTFNIRAGSFPEDAEGTVVAFPSVQTYDSGEEVAWIEDTVEGQDEPENPVPTITVGPAEDEDAAAAQPAAATNDGDAAGEQAAATSDDDGGSSEGLAIAGLVVGLVGLGTAVFALMTARKKPAPSST
jgi:uncharacterized protein